MRLSETIFTTAASRRRAIACCFHVVAAVAAIGPGAFLSQSHAATLNSNDFVGGYESLTGMFQSAVFDVDGSGVDVEMRAEATPPVDSFHSTSGVLVSGALEPNLQELGIDSSIRTIDSALNEINTVPDFPDEALGFFFGIGSPQSVTITSLTFNRLDGADSFVLIASNNTFPVAFVTFDGAGSWSGPSSSVTAVIGDDLSTGWRVSGSDLFGGPIDRLFITANFETGSGASFVEIAFTAYSAPEPSPLALTSLGLATLRRRRHARQGATRR